MQSLNGFLSPGTLFRAIVDLSDAGFPHDIGLTFKRQGSHRDAFLPSNYAKTQSSSTKEVKTAVSTLHLIASARQKASSYTVLTKLSYPFVSAMNQNYSKGQSFSLTTHIFA